MIAAAYPGVKAIFKHVNLLGPELRFDVVVWKESGAEAVGLIVVPGHVDLYQPGHAPVPIDYVFSGYAYCP